VIRHPAGISPGQPPCTNARPVDHKRQQACDGPAYRSNVRCRRQILHDKPPWPDANRLAHETIREQMRQGGAGRDREMPRFLVRHTTANSRVHDERPLERWRAWCSTCRKPSGALPTMRWTPGMDLTLRPSWRPSPPAFEQRRPRRLASMCSTHRSRRVSYGQQRTVTTPRCSFHQLAADSPRVLPRPGNPVVLVHARRRHPARVARAANGRPLSLAWRSWRPWPREVLLPSSGPGRRNEAGTIECDIYARCPEEHVVSRN
jgi:hypothetical protein